MKRPVVRLPLASLSDAELASIAASGDEAAYEAIVRRYEPALRRYCRRLTREDARADDAVQQTLVSAWSALRQGAEVRELKAWLHRIAHNAVVRGVTRERESPGSADLNEQAQSASAVIELSMETRAALTAVAALPAHQRAALVGTAIDGRSRGEMARELGLSEGAVRQLLHRARATLREAVAGLTPLGPVVRFFRRRSEGLPVSDAAPLAGGSAGAVVAAVFKVGAILAATGGLAAVPMANSLLSRALPASKSVESVAGLPGIDNAPPPPGTESQPIAYDHGTGGRTTTSATPAAVAAPDASDPSSDGQVDTADSGGDSSDSGSDSSDESSDAAASADESPGPGADAATDPAQTSDAVDPATDTSPPVDPAPDPAPADAAPADPLLTP